MELDIKKAIKSPFSDPKWYIRLILPSFIFTFWVAILSSKPYVHKILALYPSILILFIFALVLLFIYAGFIVQFRHNSIYNLKPLIPDIKGNTGNYFVQGLCFGLINFAYFIINKLLELIGHIPVNGVMTLFLGIFILCVYILFLIAGAFSQNIYADYFFFHKAFDYKKIFNLMSKVKKEIFIYFICFFVSMAFYIITIIPFVIISKYIHMQRTYFLVLLFLAVSAIGLILLLMLYNLQAQVYQIAKNRLENKEIAIQDSHETI